MWYVEHIQQLDERILPIQTGVRKPAFLVPPLRQSTVIKMLLAVFDVIIHSNVILSSLLPELHRISAFLIVCFCHFEHIDRLGMRVI